MKNSDKKCKALIALLEDPDERIYLVVSQVIRREGFAIIDRLLEAENNLKLSELHRGRAAEIARTIQIDEVRKELSTWKESSEKDLLQAILSLTKIHDTALDEAQVIQSMEVLRKDVWLELNDHQTAFEQVKVLNHVFFNITDCP